MTNTKSTKRALLVSVMAMVICFTMLLGTTFAWFTDTAKSGNNVIKSGNLEVQFDYWDGDSWESAESVKNIFDPDALWEPGYTDLVYVRVTNVGSLAFNYTFNMYFTETEGTNLAGAKFKLSEYIHYTVDEVTVTDAQPFEAETTRPTEPSNGTKISAGNHTTNDNLEAGEAAYFAITVWMPSLTGNEANHETNQQPTIKLYLDVLATQKASESDHFKNNQYDNNSTYPETVVPSES